ncbi:hypothetical protein [Streptomyces sp. NPDC008150]|uniref:hypothetical protein n=1 Tax=Streptomyces sp. NPDC008150 TaxID=3364816 RepID=UPI0036E7C1EB
MRVRATVAAVSGALALSALVVPAAQAAGGSGPSWADQVAKVKQAESTPAAANRSAASTFAAETADPVVLDATFSGLKIASAVKVGTTNHVATTVTYKVTHAADLDFTSDTLLTGAYIYKGSYDEPVNMLFGDEPATCTNTSATVATCKGDIDIYPAYGELLNSDAGAWHVGALAESISADGTELLGYADQGGLAATNVQRYSQLTVNAAPEPVVKGKTVTVTGKLSRANWETNKYAGYSTQSVKLQYRKKSSTTYTTLKTIKTSTTGTLKTTVKATADGYYRFSFAGTTTTPAVSAAGDYVDVK